MLHRVDNSNNKLIWYCHNPKCSHHGCANWHRDVQCGTHTTVDSRTSGEPLSVTVGDPGLIFVDAQHIQLPACECGSVMTIRIPTEEESAPATIHRDIDNKIVAVEIPDDHPAPNFTIIEYSLELIRPDQAITRQLIANAHNAPADPVHLSNLIEHLAPQYKRIIADVRPHPVIVLHTQAMAILLASGDTKP